MLRPSSKKRVLVAGGAGFIGSHLCEALLDKGLEVICLDNLYTGTKENIQHLLSNPNFEFLRHDITFPIYLEVDEIYNLACPASPFFYQQDPVQTTKTSVLGSINLLGLAKRTKAKILLASTSEIYGDPLEHPQKESYWGNVNTLGIRSCYDEGKRCAESLFMDYHRKYGVQIKIARIFNTYGPKMQLRDGRVVTNFIEQVLNGKDITIYGSGNQTRSFCYIDDLIEGLVLLMDTETDFLGAVNLGNPKEFTVMELAKQICSLHTDTIPSVIFSELPQDDPKQRKPDISLAKKLLNWTPSVPLEEGLIKTFAFFKEKQGLATSCLSTEIATSCSSTGKATSCFLGADNLVLGADNLKKETYTVSLFRENSLESSAIFTEWESACQFAKSIMSSHELWDNSCQMNISKT